MLSLRGFVEHLLERIAYPNIPPHVSILIISLATIWLESIEKE